MKEIPMLFSTPMIQALLAGRKTQTRRLVQPTRGRQSEWLTTELINSVPHGEIIKGGWQMHHPKAGQIHAGVEVAYNSPLGWVKCPYGQPGDLIWVRETWGVGCRPDPFQGSIDGIEFKADAKFIDDIESLPLHLYEDFDYGNYDKSGWRPSIHMPKAIARIWLQVTDIRAERLQDITEDDAQAEGMEKMDDSPFPYKLYSSNTASCADAKTSFKFLWQGINGDESWEANPWVWCVSFKVLSTTGKPSLLTENSQV